MAVDNINYSMILFGSSLVLGISLLSTYFIGRYYERKNSENNSDSSSGLEGIALEGENFEGGRPSSGNYFFRD